MQIWLNALRLIQRGANQRSLDEARQILEGVETIWFVRARGAPAGWFPWPSTVADGGDGSVSGEEWLGTGPLKFLGYTVGSNGEPKGVRWAVLERAFNVALPPVFPPQYLAAWGDPGSAQRLHKIADSIAAFARNAKRRDPGGLGAAIADWVTDLDHLHDKFYATQFGFDWPQA